MKIVTLICPLVLVPAAVVAAGTSLAQPGQQPPRLVSPEIAATLNGESLRDGLELVWFATGREDFLLGTTEATVELFRGHGFDVEYHESGGGHTWINWREYLRDFAPRLFQH